MDLVLGRGEWDRDRGDFPPWRQQNCYLAETKTDPRGYNILSRAPLVVDATWGGGPVHGLFKQEGLFSGDLFAVSGGNLYRAGSSLGAIGGSGPVKWAAGNNEMVLTRGASAYSYNGTNLAAIAFPDGADVTAVHWMAGRFVFLRAGSGRFYWSELNDGRTIDGLSFATAESEQDQLLDIAKTGDLFIMFGSSSIEKWVITGDPDLPWNRVTMASNDRGIIATGCVEEIEGAAFFVSSDGMVCLLDQAPVRISDNALDEKIRQSSSYLTFSYHFEGKTMLCIRLDAGTYVLDLALENMPLLFTTDGRSRWAPKCAVQTGAIPRFGDDTNGGISIFGTNSSTDSGQSVFERVFTIGAPGDGVQIHNVLINGNSGVPTGTMTMELRFSRDGGQSFSAWKPTTWSTNGAYRQFARFGSLGTFRSPGFLAEVRLTQCKPLRVASARANESVAGRSVA